MNFFPKHLILDLIHLNISEKNVTTNKQLQILFWKAQFTYANEIESLDEKLCSTVFPGKEAFEQPFVYHYATDKDGHLILGDSSHWEISCVTCFTFYNLFYKL